MKKFNFLVLLFLFAGFYLKAQEWNQLGQNIGYTDKPMESVALNGDGTIMAYSTSFHNSLEVETGTIRVIQFDGENWNQIGQDLNLGSIVSISYSKSAGISLSLSDDGATLIAGAPYTNDAGQNSGKVRVYKYNGTNWIQSGADIIGDEQTYFGAEVSVNAVGDTFVVGGNLNSTSTGFSGYVKAYKLNGNNWEQLGQTIYSVEGEGHSFGNDVDINDAGNIIAVSTQGNTAKVFQLDGTIWIQTAIFQNVGAYYVSLNAEGNMLAVGSAVNTNPNTGTVWAGEARVYRNQSGNWEQIGNSLFGTAMFQWFGRVELNAEGNILAVGSEGISSQYGKANVYKFVDDNWFEIGSVVDDVRGSFFGHNVKLNREGTIMAVGSREGTGTGNPHLAKVFEYNCTISQPVTSELQPICQGGSVVISVEEVDEITYYWYESADATESIFTGSEYEIHALQETTSYWVEAVNFLDCKSPRTEVIVTVLPAPELIIEASEIEICEANEATLYAESPNNVIFWYANEDDEEYVYHGNLFITPELTEDTTYWVEAYDLATGCFSDRVEITITVSEAIAAPIAEPTQYFMDGTTLADLEVEHTGTLTWYADAALTQELPETTLVVAGTTYYVTQSSGACQSAATAILVDTFLGSGNLSNDKFAFYPNPVKDILNITDADEIKSVSVYDLTGRKVKVQSVNAKEAKINLSDLSSGNYVVHVETSKEVRSVKIIKK